MKTQLLSFRSFLLLICILVSSSAKSQLYLTEEWTQTTGIPDTIDYSASKVDGSGNIYVTTNTISATENANILTTKYNSSGVVQWEVEKDNADENDYGSAIEVDGSGNVYVGAATWVDGTNKYDFLLIKYNSSGTQQWTATYNGAGNFYDIPTDIHVDGSGNVYITGGSYGSGTLSDYCTIKYNSSGSAQWTSRYDYSSDQDIGAIIKEAPSGRIYIVGASENAPGSWDFAVVKYNQSSGVEMASNRNSASGSGFDQVFGADVDADGNIYITGRAAVVDEGFNMRTVKLDTTVSVLWARNYDHVGLDDESHGIIVDLDENVYVTGWITKEDDTKSFVTIKYNSSGTYQWHREEHSPNSGLDAYSLKISSVTDGNIVVAGNIDNGASLDFLTVIYNSDGDRLWMEQYDSPNKDDDKVNFVKADVDGIFYVGGKSYSISTSTNRLIKYSAHDYIIPPDDDMDHPSSLTFFENKGQIIDTDDELVPEIKYYTHRHTPSLYFTDDILSYVWSRIDTTSNTDDTLARIDLLFPGSNGSKEVHRANSQRGEYLNYYLAHCPDGITNVRSSDRLIVSELYDEVDLEYYFDESGLKYYIIIKPGWSEQNDPISLLYDGADEVNINIDGTLEIKNTLGTLTQKIADAYQIDAYGDIMTLGWDAEYVVIDDFEIGFDLDTYDTGFPLVIEMRIDGITAVAGTSEVDWATLYGGENDDVVTDIFVENYKNILVAGFMNSTTYPTTYFIEYDGLDYDAFIQNFTSEYSANWAIILGGNESDKGGYTDSDSDPSITVNSLGDVFIAGSTSSDEFPTQEYDPVPGSFNVDERSCPADPLPCPQDGYIARFNNAGTELIWSTYIGSDAIDELYGIVVNNNDEIIVVGQSGSSGVGFDNFDPGGSSFYDVSKGDGAIYSINNDAELIWGTQFGGNDGGELIRDVTLDGEENIIITGFTGASSGFPTTGGAFQTTYGGGQLDAFIGKFNSFYETEWITYVGGAGSEEGTAVEVDLSNNVYIGGFTIPDGAAVGLPTFTTYGGGSWYSDTYQGGTFDAILGKFEPNGDGLLLTYFGTPGWELITDIASDGDNIYYTGHIWIDEFDYDDGNQIPDFVELTDFYFDDAVESSRSSFIGSMNEIAEPRLLTYLGNTALDMANTIFISGQQILVGGEALNYLTTDEFLPLQDPGAPAFYQGAFNNTPAAINVINNDGFIFVDTDEEIIYTEVNKDVINGLSIYPNPTNNLVNIVSNEPINSFDIRNLGGQILESKIVNSVSNIIQINLSYYPNGIYFINVNTDKNSITSKIILNK